MAEESAQAGNETLLTETAGDAGGEKQEQSQPGGGETSKGEAAPGSGEAEKAKDGTGDEETPKYALEDYKLELPEGHGLPQDFLEGLKTKALEAGISPEHALAMAGYLSEFGTAAGAKAQEAQLQKMAETEKGWVNELKQDKDYDAILADGRRAMAEYGDEELVKVLEDSRLGSYPAFVRFMAKVGKALAEPGVMKEKSRPGAAETSLADSLFGKSMGQQ